MQANRIYKSMVGKSTRLQVIPQQSTQNKHSKFSITDMQQKPGLFLLSDMGVSFDFRNNFCQLRFLCKSFLSFTVYNSLKIIYVIQCTSGNKCNNYLPIILLGIGNSIPSLHFSASSRRSKEPVPSLAN